MCIRDRTGVGLFRFPLSYSLEAELGRVLRQSGATVVLDVGGHRGQFGSRMRHMGFRGQIVSFEPGPDVAALHVVASDDGNWRVVEAACGARPERLQLNVMRGTDFNSLHQPDPAQASRFPSMEVVGTREVDVVRIDDATSSIVRAGDTVLLKSDTQGHDLEVLTGAERLWPQIAGVLVEASVVPLYRDQPVIEDAISFMRDRGFLLAGAFPISRPDIVVEFDCLFVRDPR